MSHLLKYRHVSKNHSLSLTKLKAWNAMTLPSAKGYNSHQMWLFHQGGQKQLLAYMFLASGNGCCRSIYRISSDHLLNIVLNYEAGQCILYGSYPFPWGSLTLLLRTCEFIQNTYAITRLGKLSNALCVSNSIASDAYHVNSLNAYACTALCLCQFFNFHAVSWLNASKLAFFIKISTGV